MSVHITLSKINKVQRRVSCAYPGFALMCPCLAQCEEEGHDHDQDAKDETHDGGELCPRVERRARVGESEVARRGENEGERCGRDTTRDLERHSQVTRDEGH